MAFEKLPSFGDPHNHVALAPGFDNPAIVRCCDAWNKTYRKKKVNKKPTVTAMLEANEAYRMAMPPLSDTQSTSDFIACVNHGMIIGAICDLQAKTLLGAAKAAMASFRCTVAMEKNVARNEKPEKNRTTGCTAVRPERELL
jgi:hypothetical protein